jgi:hypothetical protein
VHRPLGVLRQGARVPPSAASAPKAEEGGRSTSRALAVAAIAAILAETPGRTAALTEGLTEGQLHTSPEPEVIDAEDATRLSFRLVR